MKQLIKILFLKLKFYKSRISFNIKCNINVTLGENSVLFKKVTFISSKIGDYSYIQSNSIVINSTIGKFCSIGSFVNIGLANHPTNHISTSPIFYDNTQPLPYFFSKKNTFFDSVKQTIIEDDVWIGNNVLIKSGIKVGIGSVIGAGSIVTKDIPPYSIAAGNPAKIIRMRFSKELVEKLIQSNWTSNRKNILNKLSNYFNEPNKFIEELNKLDKSDN